MASWRDRYGSAAISRKNGGDTSLEDLTQVLCQTKPLYRSLPVYDTMSSLQERERQLTSIDCDQVYPGIYIGDGATAMDRKYLKNIGITHVLNTAEGSYYGMVNTCSEYYRGTGIKYMGLPLLDLPTINIAAYFNSAANFIEDAIRGGGKVYVHCVMGISRSSTCVLAYLMLKKGFSARDALRRVKQSRDIYPNEGFLQQLADLDNRLRILASRPSSVSTLRTPRPYSSYLRDSYGICH